MDIKPLSKKASHKTRIRSVNTAERGNSQISNLNSSDITNGSGLYPTMRMPYTPPPTPFPLPLQILQNGSVVRFDKRAFFGNGLRGDAVDLACLFYQFRIWTEVGFPEGFEDDPNFREREKKIIGACAIKAFRFYNLTSYEEVVYRITYFNGICSVVSFLFHTKYS